MADSSKSFLSRCTWALSWRRKREQNQLNNTVERSWPRTKRCHKDLVLTEDDCTPLLGTLCSPRHQGFGEIVVQPPRVRKSQATGYSRSQIRISKSLLVVSLYVLLGIISLAPQTEAAPLRSTSYINLLERQSIPDRFGNTGNEPGVVSSEDANEIGPDAASSTVTVTATRTISSVPTNSVVASGSPLSSISTATPITTPGTTSTGLPPSTLTTFVSSPTSIVTPSSPPDANPSSPAEPLLRTTPISPFNTATLAGTIAGASILLLIIITSVVLIYKRRKTRQIEEIPIRRSKLGSRLAFRVFGSHYDDRIARSRTGSRDDGAGSARFTERRRSSAKSVEKDMTLKVPKQTYGAANPSNGPISPSVYSPRLTRISTMTFGSVGGWLDKSVIGRPVPAFTGTPSQLLDAPKPLFAKQDKVEDEKWLDKSDISAPRPARPGSAEPLGRLSGMGYGLGMGIGK